MGIGASKITYSVRCEVVAARPEGGKDATCDMEIRVHCEKGALPVVLMYSMRQDQLYTHKIEHDDIGRVMFVECAVRRGAPSARGAIASASIPFCIKALDVVETRFPSVHVAVFERKEAMNLGDALGLSVLLQPVRRSASQDLVPRTGSVTLATIAEDSVAEGSVAEGSVAVNISACEAV